MSLILLFCFMMLPVLHSSLDKRRTKFETLMLFLWIFMNCLMQFLLYSMTLIEGLPDSTLNLVFYVQIAWLVLGMGVALVEMNQHKKAT